MDQEPSTDRSQADREQVLRDNPTLRELHNGIEKLIAMENAGPLTGLFDDIPLRQQWLLLFLGAVFLASQIAAAVLKLWGSPSDWF